jgi:hypothetical protein
MPRKEKAPLTKLPYKIPPMTITNILKFGATRYEISSVIMENNGMK